MTESIEDRIESLYGRVDWSRQRGCLHVAAIHGPSHRVIAIGPAAPASATDRFVLGFARARADAVLTTGAILRAEPELQVRYAESEAEDLAFAQWRRSVLGLSDPPKIIVLSGSGRFPTAHPALRGRVGWLYTTDPGRARIGAPPPGFDIVVGEHGQAAGRAAIGMALSQGAVRTVSVEAGPTTATPLYAAGDDGGDLGIVDELLLSRFAGPLAKQAIGPPFVPAERLRRNLGEAISQTHVEEPSGAWSFARYRARTRRAAE